MTTDRYLIDRVHETVVGRRRETELVVAALDAGRHIVLEGPPGTGKSTLLRAVASELGVGFEFVEGNAELTPARLIGHFDPARVLADGYTPEVFIDGPLAAALRSGSLLYIEELNRIPDETLNVLVNVMSEASMTVPRLGRLDAAPGFRLVAAMNPFDAVGTARISGAIYDRVCRLSVDYQEAGDEEMIVDQQRAGLDPHWRSSVVEVVRRTRQHPDIRVGSSVRGAIDLAAIATSLANLRSEPVISSDLGLDAAIVALSGRVQLRETGRRRPEDVIAEIWTDVFAPPAPGTTDEGKASAPAGATTPGRHHR